MQTIFFDVDGVLLDSLPQHLAICRDKAGEFGLDPTAIPDVTGFRRLVDSGVKVSPMRAMFSAFGFPGPLADRAVADYDRHFMHRYPPAPFAGIGAVLASLRHDGYTLGLVTANVRANVEPALADALQWIDPGNRYFFDSFETPQSKADLLRRGAHCLGRAPDNCLYVGDQPADAAAAAQAGWHFLAVTYGWGFSQPPLPANAASTVEQIVQRVKAGQFTT